MVWIGLLFGLMFRYGAVELVGLVKFVQQLSCPVERRMSTGHSLVRDHSRCFQLGPHAGVTVWLSFSARWPTCRRTACASRLRTAQTRVKEKR